MLTTLLAVLTWAASALPADYSAASYANGDGLVAWTVTVEGTATTRVVADTCRLEFTVAAIAPTAEESLEKLKGARKTFETAVRTITGSGGKISFAPPTLAVGRKDKHVLYDARQTATVSLTSFPENTDDFNDFVAGIAASVAQSGAVPADCRAPAVTFRISHPQALEEKLVRTAIEDAARRKLLASKALGRSLGAVRAAYLPAGVTAGDSFVAFGKNEPLIMDEMVTFITYTVKIAYELEP